MKKMTILFLTIMICLKLSAPPSGAVAIFHDPGYNPFTSLWDATCIVESGKDRFAIGDNGKSYGIAQIQQSRLNDYFNRTGIHYTLQDMFDVQKSRQIFMYYCFSPYHFEAISRSWNGGNNYLRIKATKVYYRKIQACLN